MSRTVRCGLAGMISRKGVNHMIYQWKAGARQKVPAQVAGELCAGLAQSGALTAANLVSVSRPEDAPLHGEFEWNDTEAAERWREQQARVLISSITVISADLPASEPVKAFVNVLYSQPEYESITAVVRQADKYAALMERALAELQSFQRKYKLLSELAPVFSAIDELQQNHRKETA